MRLHLRDDGYPFKKIVHGRKWIGRVCKHADGGYLGIIGKTSVRAATEIEAFEEVGARWMGWPSAAALKQNNSRVRRVNKHRRDEARHVLNEIMRGNFAPLDRLMGLPPKGGDR